MSIKLPTWQNSVVPDLLFESGLQCGFVNKGKTIKNEIRPVNLVHHLISCGRSVSHFAFISNTAMILYYQFVVISTLAANRTIVAMDARFTNYATFCLYGDINNNIRFLLAPVIIMERTGYILLSG